MHFTFTTATTLYGTPVSTQFSVKILLSRARLLEGACRALLNQGTEFTVSDLSGRVLCIRLPKDPLTPRAVGILGYFRGRRRAGTELKFQNGGSKQLLISEEGYRRQELIGGKQGCAGKEIRR